MRLPTHEQTFQVLLLQAADEGRGDALFGDSLARAQKAVPAFLVGEKFPDVYLEHPLCGTPFLDVTVLLKQLEPGTRVASPAAGEHAALLDWYADTRRKHPNVACGFEVDTSEQVLPSAAVHFQPLEHTELVRPFCEAIGEAERANLYLDQNARMPSGWPLAFFGMFRGRPGSPVRVCGYLDKKEKAACSQDPGHLAAAFDAAGFTAYNDAMLSQASALMAAAGSGLDYQFDVLADGSLGSTFAIDIQFDIEQPEAVQANFATGPGADVMRLLEEWGAADSRWKKAVRSAFAARWPSNLTTAPAATLSCSCPSG